LLDTERLEDAVAPAGAVLFTTKARKTGISRQDAKNAKETKD